MNKIKGNPFVGYLQKETKMVYVPRQAHGAALDA